MASKIDASGCGCCVALVAIVGIYMGAAAAYGSMYGEREGEISTEGCRIKLSVRDGDYPTWFRKFTCSYARTGSGALMWGTCAAVDTEAGNCQTAYTYFKQVKTACTDPHFPNLGYDDLCHASLP